MVANSGNEADLLLELGQFDTSRKCTNGGEVANGGRIVVPRFDPEDGHQLFDEHGSALKRSPKDSFRFWQKAESVPDRQ
jgi:hypothetical protein